MSFRLNPVVYKLFVDGAITRNPGGEASFGFILYESKRIVDFGYGIIGSGANMNSVMAECFAITQGLHSFIRYWNHPKSELNIFSDSKYVVSQLTKKGEKSPDFHIIDFQLQEINRYLKTSIRWIPRSGNRVADNLAKRLRNKKREIDLLNCQKHTQ
jgi:ribonuclease HI